MKAYICEMCRAQLDPSESKDGLLKCPYCGQVYSLEDEIIVKYNKPSVETNSFDYSTGEEAFLRIFKP